MSAEVRRHPTAHAHVRICLGAAYAFRRVAVRRIYDAGEPACGGLLDVRRGRVFPCAAGRKLAFSDGSQGVALPGQTLRGRLDATGGIAYADDREHEVDVRVNRAGVAHVQRVYVWRAAVDAYFRAAGVCECAGCRDEPVRTPATASPPAPRKRPRVSAKAKLFRRARRIHSEKRRRRLDV